MTCNDYTCQPPQATSTSTTQPSVFPPMHPVTGSDVIPIAGLGVMTVLFGVILLLALRLRRAR